MFDPPRSDQNSPAFSRAWTVSEVNAYLRALMESDTNLQGLLVQGEVSNLARPRSGHIYFTLKDQGGSLRCVMWRSRAEALDFDLQEGDAVEARGSISIYEQRGEYQLYVDVLRPRGEGRLYQEFLQLKARLEAEGLFDAEKKQPIPAWPRTVGIVTSGSGAALQDMLDTLRRRYPLVKVLLSPTVVQGESAPPQIVKALDRLIAHQPDVILIGRGGGSIEDLWAFNDETVARAVFSCPIPVISGVGHETDFTIADFVADHRAPTPTAAAEVAVPDQSDLRASLAELEGRLIRRAQGVLAEQHRRVEDLDSRMALFSPMILIQNGRQRVDELSSRLTRTLQGWINLSRQQTLSLKARLESLNPEAILKRGYAVVTDKDGAAVYRVGQVAGGDALRVRVTDGTFQVTVDQ